MRDRCGWLMSKLVFIHDRKNQLYSRYRFGIKTVNGVQNENDNEETFFDYKTEFVRRSLLVHYILLIQLIK